MEYLELGKVFKVNVDDKTVYLKVEPDGSQGYCTDCYFNKKGVNCVAHSNCSYIDREDDTNVMYKEINPIQDIFVVFGIKIDGGTKQVDAYPNEKDARKIVAELNRYYSDFTHYYEKIQYYPYGIITDIKEVTIN